MSHTNTTTNYGLPQFLSSDKPAWMSDINVAFADIDSQMKTNADAASAAQTTADDAVLNGAPGYSNLSTYAVGDVVNYLGRVYKCDIAVTTPEAFDSAKWSYYRLSDASAQLDVIDGEIGSTDISGIGDGSITGALSTVNSNLTELNQARIWKQIASFNSNVSAQNWLNNVNISAYEDFKVDLLINGVIRQTILTTNYGTLISSNGIFPDFMTSDGRVYMIIKANDTKYTVTSLTGLSALGAGAIISIWGR